MTVEQVKAEIYRWAQAYGVDPALALAVGQTESSFNPGARGAAGEIGVMQLMPGTAAEVGVNPLIPEEGIRGGVMYLGRMLALSGGDAYGALWAYNAGPGNKAKGILPASTRSYIDLVLSRIPQYRGYVPNLASSGPVTNGGQVSAPDVSPDPGSWLPGSATGQNPADFGVPDGGNDTEAPGGGDLTTEQVALYAGIGLGALALLWALFSRH